MCIGMHRIFVHQPIPNDGDESEEEDTQGDGIPTLMKGPSRRVKVPINYREMMVKEYVKTQVVHSWGHRIPIELTSFLSLLHPVFTRETHFCQMMIQWSISILVHL